MIKKALLVVSVFAMGSMGLVWAQDGAPPSGRMSNKEVGHVRIVTLKDRIQSQRQRIAEGLANKTLTEDQAGTCSVILDSIETQMKAEREANGPKKIMTSDNYDGYNTRLDTNSSIIHEQKQFFYYYGPYADSGPNYNYYTNDYPTAGVPVPAVAAMEKDTPRIFELRERIKSQRARIKADLNASILTNDEARDCGVILDSVQNQMKADFDTNSSHQLTREQYTSLNKSLDANSTLIQESKHYFYYYDDLTYN